MNRETKKGIDKIVDNWSNHFIMFNRYEREGYVFVMTRIVNWRIYIKELKKELQSEERG